MIYRCTEDFELLIFDEDDDSGEDKFMTINKGTLWDLTDECPINDAELELVEVGGAIWLGIHQELLDAYFEEVRGN